MKHDIASFAQVAVRVWNVEMTLLIQDTAAEE